MVDGADVDAGGALDSLDSLAPTPDGRSTNACQPCAASSDPAGMRTAAAHADANITIFRLALSWRSRSRFLP